MSSIYGKGEHLAPGEGKAMRNTGLAESAADAEIPAFPDSIATILYSKIMQEMEFS